MINNKINFYNKILTFNLGMDYNNNFRILRNYFIESTMLKLHPQLLLLFIEKLIIKINIQIKVINLMKIKKHSNYSYNKI